MRYGAGFCLKVGANNLGGVLMYESITRAAGGRNGQFLDGVQMQALASALGLPSRQRTMLYLDPSAT